MKVKMMKNYDDDEGPSAGSKPWVSHQKGEDTIRGASVSFNLLLLKMMSKTNRKEKEASAKAIWKTQAFNLVKPSTRTSSFSFRN
ncbi:hypothetical protein Tco_1151510 [Tanacetum coccineum]